MTLIQFFLFVARVSGVTPLAGPVAKKKAVTRRPRTGKNHSKIELSDVIFDVNDVVLLKNGAAVDLLHPSCCKVVGIPMTLEYTPHIKRCLCRLLYNAGQFLSN